MKVISLVVTLLFVSTAAHAQARSLWIDSAVTLAASDIADLRSSHGLTEVNPLLGRGPFGAQQVGISAGITGGAVALQYLACRHGCSKKKYFAFTLLNIGVSGVHFWLANRQFNMPRNP